MSSRPPNSRHRPQQEERKQPKTNANEARNTESNEPQASPVHELFSQASQSRINHVAHLGRGDHHDTSGAMKNGGYKPQKQKNRQLDTEAAEARVSMDSLTAGITRPRPTTDWIEELDLQRQARGLAER